MNTTIAERLQIILNQKSLTASAFAEEIDVQRSNISHIISGRSKPSLDFIEKMCARFPDIDISWFISGKAANRQVIEKQVQRDLFGQIVEEPQPIAVEVPQTLPIPQATNVQQITANQLNERKIVKIITFFSDNSFQEFVPEVDKSVNTHNNG
ncbi:MAG: helix-turn-helix domain-containing protein [Lentimicrobiaceae bacterium]|jgi:transcriptional regulator with XRE-family HTH domain|nr:helix-turn-helix domain-containing protein [Lentimicrobiaceae bacterium]